MKKKILLFLSRDLCYESNRYFMSYLEEAFEKKGYDVDTCDLSIQMEEKLENLLEHQEEYFAAIDFNSLLPRLELEDGTPYLEAFKVPFWNYLVDHPLYHHVGIKRSFSHYSVICIDTCHQMYMQKYYPHIKNVSYLPLGATEAEMTRSFDQKRFELLFLGTFEQEQEFLDLLADYPIKQQKEIKVLIEMMQADSELTQEHALEIYLKEQGEKLSDLEFGARLNQNYLADKYLRDVRRKKEVLAAAKSGIPFTIIGHGWDELMELDKSHISVYSGIGYAAAIQMMANAKMLLNTTPEFHGGLHDRVYIAMQNRTLCFTEYGKFAASQLKNEQEVIFYDYKDIDTLPEKIYQVYQNPDKIQKITENAYNKAKAEYSWDKRAEELLAILQKKR
ncbi:MAG: glycosyltransferase family 1 protein [Lachnospiraceae bacterium]|nr:glycosyltransferase family 1 protein [Lachnospiraceae bacterium]